MRGGGGEWRRCRSEGEGEVVVVKEKKTEEEKDGHAGREMGIGGR